MPLTAMLARLLQMRGASRIFMQTPLLGKYIVTLRGTGPRDAAAVQLACCQLAALSLPEDDQHDAAAEPLVRMGAAKLL